MDPSFIRYLKAKKAIDDRSLNRHVWSGLAERIGLLQEERDVLVLEVGCGIGTMVERMFDAGLLIRALYTALDVEPDTIAEARNRLCAYANERGLTAAESTSTTLSLRRGEQHIDIELIDADAFTFIASRGKAFDLLVAHAFLDLVDLEASVQRFISAVRPGGLLYLTLNFDGSTIFEPPVDAILDAKIERLYHATMDESQPGRSRTGRRLLALLSRLGVAVLAAGSSDWVVHPGPNGFSPDESYFLNFIVDTLGRALAENNELDNAMLAEWLEKRHRMIDENQLMYIAHQLDVLATTNLR